MGNNYLNRLLDSKIDLYLTIFGAILIEGPKWCGKTTTAIRHSKTVLKMQDPTGSNNNILVAQTAPEILLEGEKPLLIDEWQVVPKLWDVVRVSVDDLSLPGQYILTGSSTPISGTTMHSGTGRIARLVMRPMSLFESLDSSGEISLRDLFSNENFKSKKVKSLDVKEIANIITRGGWPQSIGKSTEASLIICEQYVKSIYENEIYKSDGSSKDPNRLKLFLKSYARNIQTLVKTKVLIEDMKENDIGITEQTIYNYMNALQRLYIIEETTAWAPNIRSKSAIRTSNKRGFVDPSIATAILGLSPQSLLKDFKFLGFLFEALCIRDLRIYAEQLGGSLSHYRDDYGLECDAVIHLKDGTYALIEIKLGSSQEELAVKSLNKLEELLNNKGFKLPEFKMIITLGEYAYRRDDGIYVIPISALRD